MKVRPILFSAPMVRALLAGTKTQTRRIVKEQPTGIWEQGVFAKDPAHYRVHARVAGVATWILCPYGVPGDLLWVRETWAQPTNLDPGPVFYRADYPQCVPKHFENVPAADEFGWKPSIHMFRKHSRITLRITDVRVERLQEISEPDAIAEGLWRDDKTGMLWLPCLEAGKAHISPVLAYRDLWQLINGPGSWSANPWVWVIAFEKQQ